MNRREALAALVSLPATTRISVAQLKPDDVIVIECDAYLSKDSLEQLRAVVEATWPGRKVAILSQGLKLKIVPGGIA